MSDILPLDLTRLKSAYATGVLSPSRLVEALLPQLAASDGDAVWIARVPADTLRARAAALEAMPPAERGPLWGIPFAAKDNIDVAGLPTTAACPAFAYTPKRSATVVDRLVAGRRHPGRQDQPRPVRHGPGRRALALRRRPQPVRCRLHSRWLQLRLGCGGLGRPRQLRTRHRHGGLRPGAGRLHQHRRPQADQGHDPDQGRGRPPAARSTASRSSRSPRPTPLRVLDVAGGFDPADPFSAPGGSAPRPRLRRPPGSASWRPSSASSSATRRPSAIHDAALERAPALGADAGRGRPRPVPGRRRAALCRPLGRRAHRRRGRVPGRAARRVLARRPGP